MKRILSPILFMLMVKWTLGQGTIALADKPFLVQAARDEKILVQLKEAEVYGEMNGMEKEMMYWINLMRKDPSGFSDTYIKSFLKQFPEARSSYSESLERELKGKDPLPLFKPTRILYSAAKSHAEDLSLNQSRLTHQSSSGASFQTRVISAGIKKCAAENLYKGKDDALKAVILLLIDQNVPDLGYRKSLLDPQLNLLSVSSYPKGAEYIVVQLFSCE